MNPSAAKRAEVVTICQGQESYPTGLRAFFDRLPESISAIGDLGILHARLLALFCPVRCPGSLILKTHDLAQKLREGNAAIVGGFHSPVERECLNVLLRSENKEIICPARGLESMRIPAEYREPLDKARLLLVSAFAGKQRQPSADMAERRNRLVVALSSRVFVAYAAPGGKTEKLCRRIVDRQKPLFTFDAESNRSLIELGASPLASDFSSLVVWD